LEQIRLALYQPDIPQNSGTILRMAACLDIPVDIVGPTGFDMTDRALRRAGLDYIEKTQLARHASFADFDSDRRARNRRLILLTTAASMSYTEFAFRAGDILMLGRESAGVPDDVHRVADARIGIPMQAGLRSLNVAVAAAMVLGEALRQTNGFARLAARQDRSDP
jgi:tRNA (cytidine/uridine-2'-O-)-methyltransferase